MVLDISKIESEKKRKNLSHEDLAQAIGLKGRGSLEYIFKKRDCKVSTLIKLSELFNRPINYWFDKNIIKEIMNYEADQEIKNQLMETMAKYNNVLEDYNELLKQTTKKNFKR